MAGMELQNQRKYITLCYTSAETAQYVCLWSKKNWPWFQRKECLHRWKICYRLKSSAWFRLATLEVFLFTNESTIVSQVEQSNRLCSCCITGKTLFALWNSIAWCQSTISSAEDLGSRSQTQEPISRNQGDPFAGNQIVKDALAKDGVDYDLRMRMR